MKSFFLFFLFAVAPLTQLHADILYIDVNNTVPEIAAAKKAAAARGENLIIIPTPGDSDQDAELLKASKSATVASTNFNRQCSYYHLDQPCTALLKVAKDAEDKYYQLQQKRFVGPDLLKQSLQNLQDQHVTIDSIIISGHDGNGKFHGLSGEFQNQDFRDALAAAPDLSKNVRALYLWGCETTTIDSVERYWKNSAPNLSLIAGFDDIAPLADKPADQIYLQDILTNEKSLLEATDKKALGEAFSRLKDVNLVKAAICRGDNFVTPKMNVTIAEAAEMCKPTPEDQKLVNAYYCYKEAQTEACANPPAGIDHSTLRNFYQWLQDKKYCSDIGEYQDFYKFLPEPFNVIKLIYFDAIKKNFVNNFGTKLGETDQILAKLGAPENLRLSDIGHLSRKKIFDRISQLQRFADEKSREASMSANELAFLSHIGPAISEVLGDMTYVPFSWIDKHSREPLVSSSMNQIGYEGLNQGTIAN